VRPGWDSCAAWCGTRILRVCLHGQEASITLLVFMRGTPMHAFITSSLAEVHIPGRAAAVREVNYNDVWSSKTMILTANASEPVSANQQTCSSTRSILIVYGPVSKGAACSIFR